MEQGHQRLPHGFDPAGVGHIGLAFEQARLALALQPFRHHGLGRAVTAQIEPHRPAVDRQVVDVHDLQPVRATDGLDRGDTEDRQMLVIDGVELVELDAGQGLRDLDDEGPLGGQQGLDPLHEAMQVVDVVQGVGGDDDLGRAVSGQDLARRVSGEIGVEDLDPPGTRQLGDIGRRVHAQDLEPLILAGRQQQTVVAADVDHQLARRGDQFVAEPLGQGGEMPGHRGRGGRDVDVVDIEVGRQLIRHLDQATLQAGVGVQRIAPIRLVQLLGPQEVVGRGVVAQRQIAEQVVGAAGAAGGHRAHLASPCKAEPIATLRNTSSV
ncbi:hypothetical protein D3C87_1282240 [compost metagenome]